MERTAVRTVADTATDPSGVVVVEMCDRFHGEPERPRNLKMCQGLQKEYDKTDYGDLMNTTFALLPAGRSPATYRLGEALSAGAIPVFIHQNFVKPFPGRIPWQTFSFTFPAEEAPRIIDTLRAVSPRKLAKMQVRTPSPHPASLIGVSLLCWLGSAHRCCHVLVQSPPLRKRFCALETPWSIFFVHASVGGKAARIVDMLGAGFPTKTRQDSGMINPGVGV